MEKTIYLDNNATTMLLPEVIEAVTAALNASNEANPSSIHSFGQKARFRLTEARQSIADYLQVRPHEIIFTSGGTEGMNMLLKGLAQKNRGHLISSNVEHSCVATTISLLEQQGIACSLLEADSWGAVRPEAIEQALRADTCLITLMAANNETGVKTDIEAIAAIAEHAKIPFIVDAVAFFGKEPLKIPRGVTAMAFSGHKFHAPKGVGFVYVRSSTKINPLLTGGEQEFGRRAGTENLLGITGMAKAVEIVQSDLHEANERMSQLRDLLENELMRSLEGVTINGDGQRICNTSNLAFAGVEGEVLLAALDMVGVAVSHGSACSSGALEPSRILRNMGYSKEIAASSIRFSLSRQTTQDDIMRCVQLIVRTVNKLR